MKHAVRMFNLIRAWVAPPRQPFPSLSTLAVAAAFAVLTATPSQARTFTDVNGRELDAEILHGNNETVTIKTSAGKNFTVPIVKFSAADQEYIKEWIKTNPPKVSYDFDLDYDRERISKKESDDGIEETTTEEWVYVWEFANRSGAPIQDLELRYRVWITTDRGMLKGQKDTFWEDGVVKAPALDDRDTATVRTKPITLIATDLNGGYYYGDGRDDKGADKLAGFAVKAFHHGEKVWEFRSDDKTAKEGSFSDADAKMAGGAISSSKSDD
ncbi:MAG: hypothetical protein AAF591_12765 [Verrucomicrobiota bacterium]